MERLDLSIESPSAVRVVDFNKVANRFLKVIRDLEVKIIDVIITIYIFIIFVVDSKYKIILRNLY